MLRSLVYLILALPVFFSCKKERTCSCTVIENGTRTVVQEQAAVSFTVFPGIPPIELIPARTDTTNTPFSFASVEDLNYKKISKGNMKQVCELTSSEGINKTSQVITSTSTITTTDVGTRESSCKIK